MRRSDFSFTANSTGFKIFYKHRFIGAYDTGEPLEGCPGYQAKEKHEDMAIAEIYALLDGRGIPLFEKHRKQIDDSWERLQKNYGEDRNYGPDRYYP